MIVRSESLLLAVDQHAADERIRLETLQRQVCNALKDDTAASQSLMIPAALARNRKVGSKQAELLSSHLLHSTVCIQLTAAQAMQFSYATVEVCSSFTPLYHKEAEPMQYGHHRARRIQFHSIPFKH
jgi:DNA mismatch repair ATPase MutL